MPISDVGVKTGVDPNISYNIDFQGWEAAHEAGLDLFKWYTGGYPHNFRVKVLAWFNLHKLVLMHTEDALSEHMEKESKKKAK